MSENGAQGAQAPQGNGKAIASLVLEIAVVCVFFGYGALVGIVLGIIGWFWESMPRKQLLQGWLQRVLY